MKNRKRNSFLLIFSVILGLFFLTGIVTVQSAGFAEKLLENFKIIKPVKSLLPSGTQIESKFIEGMGPVIGTVQKIQGTAYVIHQHKTKAYKLKRKFPLFTGDTLITLKRSRINAVMNDKSILALASYSKLFLSKSVYNAKKNKRSSLLGLFFGRIRLIVKKIGGKPNFNVKTPTAVCGVRGTDFAISVAPEQQKTSSLENFLSKLTFVSKAYAFVPGALLTTVVTGPASSVSLAGTVGTATIVGPSSIAAAATGAAASTSIVIGAAAATSVLNSIAPGLASLSMPPEFD